MPDDNLSYFGFCPTLQEVLRSGEVYAEDQSKISVHSGSTLNNLRVLREIIRARKSLRTMEIGLAFGVSALTILGTLEESGSTDYLHTALDPFQKEQWRNAALVQIQQANLQERFRFMETFSSLALPRLFSQGESFDLIYIDGSHQYDHAFVDYYYCIRLLRKGGVLLLDDCTTPDVSAVVKFARKRNKHFAEPIDLSPYDNPDKALPKRIANQLGIRQLKGFCKTSEPLQMML